MLENMNDMQREAVLHTEGPLLILAGAGSGKTRVITHRIAYLIEEKGVNPWNIMAITFTNKAAGEMRERVDDLVGFGSEHIWVSTFHSSCVKILRRYIDRIGYDNSFTIYDTDDSKTLMRDICKRLNYDTKQLKEKTILSYISSAKNELISPDRFLRESSGDFNRQRIGKAYKEYQEQLKKNNALDFDDLLVKTVELFDKCPEVIESYQERLKYIMVDEYQDTNTVQFKLISQLAGKYHNLCVVGDDDQSIYKFRGANIKNILNFEEVYTDARVIKLEQNYRSTSNILNAANAVISHNFGRKDKTLWTDKEDGDKITLLQFENAYEEAEFIARDIEKRVNSGTCRYNSNACLYRTNAQSRVLEEKLVNLNIPYKLVGGVNFYQRKEIKDMLAYLKTVDNGRDDLAVKRVINVPKRGIGLTSIDRIQTYADLGGISFLEACEDADNIPGIGRAAGKIKEFVNTVRVTRSIQNEGSLREVFKYIMDETGYIKELKLENTEEADERIENVNELLSKIVDYEKGALEPSLSEFLEEVALVADIDSVDGESDYVILMTIHSAKGLEFPNVYLSGMEDGLFPSYMSINSDDPTDIEEERRLCYVAITRAMEHLTISHARARMIRGEIQYNKPSRFVSEIPAELFEHKMERKQPATSVSGLSFGKTVSSFGRSTPVTNYGSSTGVGKRGMSARELLSSSAFDKKQSQSGGRYDTSSVGSSYAGGNASNSTPSSTILPSKKGDLGYGVGDTVKHMKFGVGTVISIDDSGRDFEVLVNFNSAGQKRMFASFAKLKKM
ncbi:MAG: DNA helicase PcrA [Clostridiales bacterium]|nr:DNA helicase PcrA [Clostridiales bacterium]